MAGRPQSKAAGENATYGWVRRRATQARACSDCGWPDAIQEGEHYYLLSSGEILCRDCPPSSDGSCKLP